MPNGNPMDSVVLKARR